MDICVLVPTLNEEKTIGEVVEGFRSLGYRVVVIDGHSKDRTVEIAESKGAEVILQTGKGKGQAIKEAFNYIDSEVLVMVDGDGTYLPEEVDYLLEPIKKGFADHVIGNRLANFEEGAFTKLNLIGNKILNFFFRLNYGSDLHDILSGYRAFTQDVYKNVDLKKLGFEVETEITVDTIAKGFTVVEVPITYRERGGETKLNPLRDGFRIARTISELLSQYSPGRYLYFLGFSLTIVGLLTGLYVTIDWFKNINHNLLAVLTALLIISGLQVIIMGVVSDFMFRSSSQMRRELIEIRREIKETKSRTPPLKQTSTQEHKK
ncbi:MAG: S-layer glycoprotein N-glycosyltransferase AglJ [Archaeoglobaceae archaeon]